MNRLALRSTLTAFFVSVGTLSMGVAALAAQPPPTAHTPIPTVTIAAKIPTVRAVHLATTATPEVRTKVGPAVRVASLRTIKTVATQAPAPVPVTAADLALLKAAVIHRPGGQGGVINFMKEMATNGQVQTAKGVLTLDQFHNIWNSNKADSKWVEEEFRAVEPDDHEWIPSNYMANVIDRARSSPEKLQWIDLQSQMRTATAMIIFKPSMGTTQQIGGKSYTVLQGHVGALELDSAPLMVGMEPFHDELRAVFDSTTDIKALAAGVAKVAAKWVWNGEPTPFPVHPSVTYQDGTNVSQDPNMIAKAKANYAAIQTMLAKFATNGVN